jgi:DNA replication protein DnaC
MNDLSQLKPKLVRLRMSGILDNLELRIKQADESKWSYSEFLLTLFQDEIERRDNKSFSLRLKRSELDPQKTLETFDFSFNVNIYQPQIKELGLCGFIEKKENIFLLGQSGVGKTHIANAIGHEACRKGYVVYFRRTLKILKWLNSGRGDGSYDRRLKMLAEVPLLILDDFGLNDMTKIQQADLYEIICARYELSSTIITSNREFAEWQTIFENQLIGSAAMDRLIHRAIKIKIEGPSYRMNNFTKKNKENALTNN